MAGKHKSLIHLNSDELLSGNSVWIRLNGSRVSSHAHLNPILDQIIAGIRSRIGKPSVQSVHGSRTAMMKRLTTAVTCWLQGFADSNLPNVSYSDKLTKTDNYNNVIRYGVLDLHEYTLFTGNEYVPYSGRIVVEMIPVLEHFLQASKLRRMFARIFPKLISTRNNKFTTTFSLKLRLWVEPGIARQTTVCSITIADYIIPPKYKSPSDKRFEDHELYRFICSYFRSSRGIRSGQIG